MKNCLNPQLIFIIFVYITSKVETITSSGMDYKFINMEYLDSVSGGDTGIIKEIVDMFREQSVEMYNEMRSLLASKNYVSLGLLAHKAKSSVAIMGMAEMALLLKTFELQAKEGKESQLYDSYIEKFRKDTGEAILELDDLISNRQKGN
jgi:HPt (histidine-containing phosphotransfer) domain-containing protein